MLKKSLSSLELAALVNELQPLANAKITQLYHQDNEFLLQLHTKTGKQFLRIIPGQFLNFTQAKKAPLQPSSLCLQLRKYLNNSTIRKIEQKDSERIIIFELEKAEKYFLIVELFSPGNLVLTTPDYQTIAVLHQHKFKDRFIRPKTKYQFPPPAPNWKTFTEPELKKILKKSEKKSLVIALALELGLGGLYAEELCKINHLDKNLPPSSLNDSVFPLIIKTLQDFLRLIEKPHGYLYEEQITPFPLVGQKEKQLTSTYNEAINTLKQFIAASPYEKKIEALKKTLSEQQEAIKNQEELIKLNHKKAEIIYQHYQPLQKLLQIIGEMKKTKNWEEIKQELKKEKKITQIDLKNKKITLNLS